MGTQTTEPKSGSTHDPADAARDARASHRSRQLLDAAARLMAKQGAQAVSMQALADEAGVSVGLIYRYFGGKDEVLLAVILDVLDAFEVRVPEAIAAAGDIPYQRLEAAFRAYCEVIDEFRHAVVLTYRESKSLGDTGLEEIMRRELDTSEPLRKCVQEAAARGSWHGVDADLFADDLLLIAHAWALKHWWFEPRMTFEEYVARQVDLVLRPLQPR